MERGAYLWSCPALPLTRPAINNPAVRECWADWPAVSNCPRLDILLTSKEESKEESPEVDIVINNVVCSFSVRCHLNLKEIALNGSNVEYRRENGMVTMKLRWVNLFEI